MKHVYRIYASPLLVLLIIVTLISISTASSGNMTGPLLLWIIFLIPTTFVYYWIEKYYDSIEYRLKETEVIVERGVWIQKTHSVPYGLIMNINTVQGPLSRKFDIGTVEIETAGHSGQKKSAEASIMGIKNFERIREKILDKIRGLETGKLRGGKESKTDPRKKILDELQKIRKILE